MRRKINWTGNKRRVIFAFFSLFFFVTPPALAFESSSASFEIHGGILETSSGSSTSASFIQQEAVGQVAVGSSTSATKGILSGVLYWLFSFFTPQYTEIHYQWRNDDGTETTATSAANQDTQFINFPKNAIKRLRFEVSNEGWTRGAAPQLMLEVAPTATCSSGVYVAVPTTYGSAWVIATSTNFVDGDPTTNQLSAENATFVSGQIKRTSNTTSAITVTSENFTEVEYALIATSVATDGATYCFRLTNSGATTNFVYTQYAPAVLSSGLSASGGLLSAIFESTGSVDGPAYNSILWKGSLNGSLGKVRFQFATSPNSTGPWTFIGGATCATNDYYDTTAPDTPVEITCSPSNHNNQRYFRYRITLCSASNCTSSGTASPIVDDVVVSWAP